LVRLGALYGEVLGFIAHRAADRARRAVGATSGNMLASVLDSVYTALVNVSIEETVMLGGNADSTSAIVGNTLWGGRSRRCGVMR
jgi:hypothetical protein